MKTHCKQTRLVIFRVCFLGQDIVTPTPPQNQKFFSCGCLCCGVFPFFKNWTTHNPLVSSSNHVQCLLLSLPPCTIPSLPCIRRMPHSPFIFSSFFSHCRSSAEKKMCAAYFPYNENSTYPTGVNADFKRIKQSTLKRYIRYHDVNVREGATPDQLAIAVARHFEARLDCPPEDECIKSFCDFVTGDTPNDEVDSDVESSRGRSNSNSNNGGGGGGGGGGESKKRKRTHPKSTKDVANGMVNPGSEVAAKVKDTWIHARVVRWHQRTKRYEVEDADTESTTEKSDRYQVQPRNIIPLVVSATKCFCCLSKCRCLWSDGWWRGFSSCRLFSFCVVLFFFVPCTDTCVSYCRYPKWRKLLNREHVCWLCFPGRLPFMRGLWCQKDPNMNQEINTVYALMTTKKKVNLLRNEKFLDISL